jgi:hypothetical protein
MSNSYNAPNTTRISDLPENITMQVQPNSFPVNLPQGGGPSNASHAPHAQQGQDGLSNAYIPMNIHPNPYVSDQAVNGEIPFPEHAHQGHRLPSRDIPMDSTGYIQDEQIKPNYIPKVTLPTDYIRDYDEKMDLKMQKHEQEKYRKEKAEDIFALLQTPIFVALLYFIFQMPIFNRLLYRTLSFLPLFKEDGHLNLAGMLFKSIAFGLIFLSADKIINYLTFL